MALLRTTFLPASLCLALLVSAHSQAVRTASKSADISVFGGVQFADPAYGPDNTTGGMFGADFARYFHLPVVGRSL